VRGCVSLPHLAGKFLPIVLPSVGKKAPKFNTILFVLFFSLSASARLLKSRLSGYFLCPERPAQHPPVPFAAALSSPKSPFFCGGVAGRVLLIGLPPRPSRSCYFIRFFHLIIPSWKGASFRSSLHHPPVFSLILYSDPFLRKPFIETTPIPGERVLACLPQILHQVNDGAIGHPLMRMSPAPPPSPPLCRSPLSRNALSHD